MRNYTPDNPAFSKQIQIVEEDDLVSADNDTAAAKQLIENDIVINDRIEKCLGKDPDHGDSKDLIVTFDSGDAASTNTWTDVSVMKSGETHKLLFGKISTMFKNVRYLYKLLGTTDISKIGDGTVTGIIDDIIDKKVNFTDISQSVAVTIAGKKVLDAIEKNAAIDGTLANLISQVNSNLTELSNIISNSGTFSVSSSSTVNVTLASGLDNGTYLVSAYVQGTCASGNGHISLTINGIANTSYAESGLNPIAHVCVPINVTNGTIVATVFSGVTLSGKPFVIKAIKLG